MEGIEEILEDWQACHPDGAVLRAANVGTVITRVVRRADSLSDPDARSRAYTFLAPASAGPPLLVRHLRIDGGHRMDGGQGVPVAVVHFLCFWQALDEVWKTARQGMDDPQSVREAVADEIAAFRGSLMASHDEATLTVGSLIESLVAARKKSADQSAWAPLQAEVARTAAAAVGSSLRASALAAERGSRRDEPHASPRTEHEPLVVGGNRDIHDEHLPLDALSMLVLPWLQGLVEDYRRGEKAKRIRAVVEALGCQASAACTYLCSNRWNLETTLRRQRAAAALAERRAEAQRQAEERAAQAIAAEAAAKEAAERGAVASERAVLAAEHAPAVVVAETAPVAETHEAHVERATAAEEPAIAFDVDDMAESPPGIVPTSPSALGPTGSRIITSVPAALPSGDTGVEILPPVDPATAREIVEAILPQERDNKLILNLDVAETEEEQDEEDMGDNAEEEDCPICAQPYDKTKGNERLMTRCCDQDICAHCAATLATNDGLLRCPFCRRRDTHPAAAAAAWTPQPFNVFQAANSFAKNAGRFVKELFGAQAEREGPRPNLRLDVVFR